MEQLPQRANRSATPASEMYSPIVALSNSRVQAMLAKRAFPGDRDAMIKWLEPGPGGISLAQRYGGYKEEYGYDTIVDLDDDESMSRLLDAVRGHAADTTLH